MMDKPTPLPEISTLIADRRQRRSNRDIYLLVGAGADISSGGLTFSQFKQEFFRLVLRKPLAGAHDDTIAREVNAFFTRTGEQEIRARLVEATFDTNQRRRPSDAYLLLALALEKLAVDGIITTNFDVMLEMAEQMLGLSVLRVYAKGSALPDQTDAQIRDPYRVPYLKLHGCLNSRTITHITDEELEIGTYPRQFRDFLKRRLATADLIVAGYSGSDPHLARLIAQSMKDRAARVYWCNPRPLASDAPFVKALGKRRIIYLSASFDEVIEAIAWPVLEAPSFTNAKAVFIPCLLDWRVGRTNRDFIEAHGHRGRRDVRGLLVRRRAIEAQLSDFLDSDKPLTIVGGPSGAGKSALGLRLLEHYKAEERCSVLLISANSIGIGWDFGEFLSAQIGGLGSRAPVSFAEFELWLRHNGRRLIVYLDALNEHAVDIDHVANLLRDIVRFCYFLPHHSPIRVVVSVRQETWNRLCSREDRGRLAAVCWNPANTPSVAHSIQLGSLTDEELQEALDLLCLSIGRPNIFADLPPQAVERLRDPYLLAGVSDEVLQSQSLEALNWVYGPAQHIYDRIFKAKLSRSYSEHDADSLQTLLARAAFLTIKRGEDQFRAADLMRPSAGAQNPDVARVFKDLGILTETQDGRLRFVHERTQEYFLAKALELPESPFSLRTPEGIDRVLKEFDHRHQIMGAIRTYFLLDPNVRFPLVANIIAKPIGLSHPSAEHRLTAFAKELMVDLACDNPPAFRVWFNRALADVAALESGDGRLGARAETIEHHWRAMIQAATHLPDATALEVLTEGARIGTTLARTEANIYATDKAVRLTLQRGGEVDLLNDPQLGPYYSDPQIPRLRRLGRILGLMSQIGPDNTHQEEYATVRAAAAAACFTVFAEKPLTDAELDWFADFIFEERDRYVFNGDLDGMRRFFRNAGRSQFLPIYDRLEEGGTLRTTDVDVLRPYIAEIYQDLEFQFGNFLFIFSAANDLKATQRLWEDCFDSFDDSTPPDTVDFFQGAAIYMYVVNGYDYDNMLDRHIDRILQECPQVIEYEPGRQRGYARGFTDEFDMVFEDGFNPIASYATLLPSRQRKRLRWPDYASQSAKGMVQLPVYLKHLTEALQQTEIRKALRIVHALGQFITLWPREGLWSMVGPAQHDHPTIHRAVIRILAEAYNRHPVETLRFFANSGIPLLPGDLRNIRARIDPRIGRRQFEGLQWGRLLHFLLSLPGARTRFFQALRIIYTASTLQEAVHAVADAFGWTKKTPSM